MQNSADAGALAGARIMAFGGTTAEAEAAARNYAEERNAAQNSDVSFDIPNRKITVIAHTNADMTFARVIGLQEVDVSARASASFASIALGGDAGPGTLAPVAIYKQDFVTVTNPISPPMGAPTYFIWDDDTEESPQDPYNIAGNLRGWLNLDCRGPVTGTIPRCATAGASLLTDWMLYGYPHPVSFRSKLWIRGDNGVKARPVAITAARIGDVLHIPLYYEVAAGEPGGPGDAIQELYPGDSYYHIVDLACFYVTGVEATGNPKGIRGYFMGSCAMSGKPGYDNNSPVKTIFLTE
jgi:hypothetical protein